MMRSAVFRPLFGFVLFFTFFLAEPVISFSSGVEAIIRTVGSGAGPSQIWYIHPSTCQTLYVGETGTSGLGSLAKNSSGILYSANYEGILVTIDPSTGQATPIVPLAGLNTPSVRALTFDQKNSLYAVTKNPAKWDEENKFYKIDITTGIATLIGGMHWLGIQALATAENGTLYAWDMGGTAFYSAGLITVNPNTGVTSDINPSDNDDMNEVKPNIQTLAFSKYGVLYGIGNGNLYKVDTTSGEATMVCFGITQGDGIGAEFVDTNWIPKGCICVWNRVICLRKGPLRRVLPIALPSILAIVFMMLLIKRSRRPKPVS